MMDRGKVFDRYSQEYDAWFDEHPWLYQSELRAVRMLLPQSAKGVEIGVGTGRFSLPFGITIGVDPSRAMAAIGRSRCITVYDAKAELLPFGDSTFDYVLMVTTVCFLDDPVQALRESSRILRPEGKIIIGMLDKDSPLGKLYEKKKQGSRFFKDANFYSAGRLLELLEIAGYDYVKVLQTIFRNPEAIKELEPIEEWHGEGLFVVISAQRKR